MTKLHAPAPAQGYAPALAALSLALLLASLGVSIANVALPYLQDGFAAPFGAVQWVVVVYLLALTTSIVAVGRLGDMVGHRTALIAGLVLFAIASGVAALAPNLPVLIAARAAQGVGGAILMALTLAMVRDIVPAEKTGRAMGLMGTVSAVGTALGPALGGVLLAGPGWRALFAVLFGLAVLALVLVWWLIRHAPSKRSGRFDLPGTLVLALAVGAYTLAMTSGAGGWSLINTLALAGVVALAWLFVRIERGAISPILAPDVLSDPKLHANLILNAAAAATVMATLVVGPFYLTGKLGLGPAQAGLVMSVGPLLSALSGLPSGWLVDRVGTNSAGPLGLAGMASGALALATFPIGFGLAGYIAALAILTPSYQLVLAANNTAVMAGSIAGQRGAISGVLNLSRNLGLTTGATMMATIFGMAAGPDLGALDAGLRATFLTAAALVAGALLIAILRGAFGKSEAGRAQTPI